MPAMRTAVVTVVHRRDRGHGGHSDDRGDVHSVHSDAVVTVVTAMPAIFRHAHRRGHGGARRGERRPPGPLGYSGGLRADSFLAPPVHRRGPPPVAGKLRDSLLGCANTILTIFVFAFSRPARPGTVAGARS
jgi:hypothetical protein